MPSMSRDACRAAAELATEGDGRGPSTVFSWCLWLWEEFRATCRGIHNPSLGYSFLLILAPLYLFVQWWCLALGHGVQLYNCTRATGCSSVVPRR